VSAQRIYLLYGSDRYTRDEQVRGLKRRLLDEPFGELNLTELSGDAVSLADLRAAADAFPFMGDRRLVVVEGLIGRILGRSKGAGRRGRSAAAKLGDSDEAAGLGEFLGSVLPSTALVLVEDQIDAGRAGALIPADRAHIREYRRPRGADLERWIERRARQLGGSITSAAARRLSTLPGDDLGAIDNELRKVVTYADGRSVDVEDVDLLASDPGLTVFAFLDALAERRRGSALGHLRRLIARGERPEAILPQAAATLHNLAMARDLLDHRVPPREVEKALGVHSFVAEKSTRQARAWEMGELERALTSLRDVDRGIKTGATDPQLALELFVVDVARS
jgi:DNA polymerase-3 subunit delta